MKKKILVASLAIAGMVFIAGGTYAASIDDPVLGGGGIRGTSHDLSSTGVGSTYDPTAHETGELDRICVWCHAPHNTISVTNADGFNPNNIAYLPLWNHGLTTITSYDMYDAGADSPLELVNEATQAVALSTDEHDASVTGGQNGKYATTAENAVNLNDTLPSSSNMIEGNHSSQTAVGGVHAAGQPGSVSKLCLSCHDGSVAVNTYGYSGNEDSSNGARVAGTTQVFVDEVSPQYLIGGMGDLSNHHPIGFNYDEVSLNDDEIALKTRTFPGTTVQIQDLLYNGQFECVTCHDVHNSKNAVGAEKFLWTSDAGSNFCLTCHLKGTLN